MDLSTCSIKLDHSVGTPEACTNWRQVPGFPVFGTGQPTEPGFTLITEKLSKEKIIWFNLRQEPVAYIGGLPVAPRLEDKPHSNVEVPGSSADVDAMEVKLVKEISTREKDGNIEVHKDAGFAENPMDREDIVQSVKLDGLKGLNEILKSCAETTMPGLTVVRVPFNEQRAVPVECFDTIIKALCSENAATTQCVFSSQLGSGRSTLGMVIASILKAVQMITKLNKMVEAGMAEKSWADNIIKTKFEDPLPSEDNKDAFMRGEFEVIKQLLEKIPETKAGKVLADKMIDICGTPPEGAGMQNMRKAIIQMKYKYDASTEDKQIIWKTMIINYIERYFFLICFATYVREHEAGGFNKTFVVWLDEHSDLMSMIAEGKDKLEWTRKVDQGKVEELRSKIDGPDYKEKLGALVSDLYKLAFQTYHDIPRGPIKDNLMRKLACKTLMEILPSDVTSRIQQELVEKKLSIDFDTVVGLVIG
eukprot:GFUD01020446.1.p1 GENE.GFUD01020446.1~~GFUD01020446.1.p1  ORF type:complete len:476 (+),score=137.66 GFUD01020446.1:161-1588(+)